MKTNKILSFIGLSFMSVSLLAGLTSCDIMNNNNNDGITPPPSVTTPINPTPTPDNKPVVNEKKITINSLDDLTDANLKKMAAQDFNLSVDEIQIADPNWKSQITVTAKEIVVTLTADINGTVKNYIYTINIENAQKKNTLIINGLSEIKLKLGKVNNTEELEEYIKTHFSTTNGLFEDVDSVISVKTTNADFTRTGTYEILIKAQSTDGKMNAIKNVPFVIEEKDTFEVKFMDGNGNILHTVTVEDGGTAVLNPDLKPIKPSESDLYIYEFTGWDKSTTNITADTVLTPQFKKISNFHTIGFVTNNDEKLDALKVSNYKTIGEALADINLTKEGYIFTGWFSNKECTVEIDLNQKLKNDMIAYAGWEEATFTVVYHQDDKVLNTLTKLLANKDELLNYKYDFTDRYTFEGWYLDKEFKTPLTADSLIYGEEINVYAKLVEKEIKIIIHQSNEPKTISGNYTDFEKMLNDLNYQAPNGYTFDGWYLDANFTQKLDINKIEYKEAYDIYPKLIAKKVKVNFVIENSSIGNSKLNEITFDKLNMLVSNTKPELKDPNRYIFEGWYLDKECKNPFNANVEYSETISLIPKLKEKTINFDFVISSHDHNYIVLATRNMTISDLISKNSSSFKSELKNKASAYGYEIVCFSLNQDKFESLDNITYKDEKMIIYALSDIIETNITFITNGKEENIICEAPSVNDTILHYKPKIDYNQFNFLGWYLDPNFTQKFNNSGYNIFPITVYGKTEEINKILQIKTISKLETVDYRQSFRSNFVFIKTHNARANDTPNYGKEAYAYWAIPCSILQNPYSFVRDLKINPNSSVWPEKGIDFTGTAAFKLTNYEYSYKDFNILGKQLVEIPRNSNKNWLGQSEWTAITEVKVGFNNFSSVYCEKNIMPSICGNYFKSDKIIQGYRFIQSQKNLDSFITFSKMYNENSFVKVPNDNYAPFLVSNTKEGHSFNTYDSSNLTIKSGTKYNRQDLIKRIPNILCEQIIDDFYLDYALTQKIPENFVFKENMTIYVKYVTIGHVEQSNSSATPDISEEIVPETNKGNNSSDDINKGDNNSSEDINIGTSTPIEQGKNSSNSNNTSETIK